MFHHKALQGRAEQAEYGYSNFVEVIETKCPLGDLIINLGWTELGDNLNQWHVHAERLIFGSLKCSGYALFSLRRIRSALSLVHLIRKFSALGQMVTLWHSGLDSAYDLENEKPYGEELGAKHRDLSILLRHDAPLVEESPSANS